MQIHPNIFSKYCLRLTTPARPFRSALKDECVFWVNLCIPDQEQVTTAYMKPGITITMKDTWANDYFFKKGGWFFLPHHIITQKILLSYLGIVEHLPEESWRLNAKAIAHIKQVFYRGIFSIIPQWSCVLYAFHFWHNNFLAVYEKTSPKFFQTPFFFFLPSEVLCYVFKWHHLE